MELRVGEKYHEKKYFCNPTSYLPGCGKARKRSAAMIKTVIRLGNDMVIALDAEGEQIPEYQGRYEDVREGILRDASSGTVFNRWFGYSLEPEVVTGEWW